MAYLGFSLTGYFSLYQSKDGIPDLIISHDKDEIFLQIAMILMTFAVFVGVALNLHPARIEIYNLIKRHYEKNFSWPLHIGLTAGLIIVGVLVTMFYPQILNVLGFVGGTTGNFIFLIFPGRPPFFCDKIFARNDAV